MALKRIKAAVIGCGCISEKYMYNITTKFHVLDLVGCSDIRPERSKIRAEQFGVKQMTNEEIWSDPEIKIVLNLTYPRAHYEVTKKSLEAGKNVLCEKMLAVELEEGKELVALARSKNLRYITAPDTFLGGGWQTARWLVDSGVIGEVVAITGMCIRTYEDNSEELGEYKAFTLDAGGGIPFDMGGYFIHNMVNMVGPIKRITGFMQTRRQERTYPNPRHPKYNELLTVESPNTITASMEFASGCVGSLVITSEAGIDVYPGLESIVGKPRIEVHGTQGSLLLGDPNDYTGDIYLFRNTDAAAKMPIIFPYQDENRGIGAADLAYAILNDRMPRADVALGYHAFEAIHGVWKSCTTGQIYEMQSTCERPTALPLMKLSGTAYEAILDN